MTLEELEEAVRTCDDRLKIFRKLVEEQDETINKLRERLHDMGNQIVKVDAHLDITNRKLESVHETQKELPDLMKKANSIFRGAEETLAKIKLSVDRAILVNDQKVLSEFQKGLDAIVTEGEVST